MVGGEKVGEGGGSHFPSTQQSGHHIWIATGLTGCQREARLSYSWRLNVGSAGCLWARVDTGGGGV